MGREDTLRTVATGLASRQNNFNLLRMAGAIYILMAHSLLIAGLEPYLAETAPELRNVIAFIGHCALKLFFLFSGIMVAMSLATRGSLCAYAAARLTRIIPALLLLSSVLALVVGPQMSRLSASAYLSHLETWLYIPMAGSGLFAPDLPGVFLDAPRAGRVDPPLWTLRYEIICYLGLAVLAATGLLSPSRLPTTLAAVFIAYCWITLGTDWRKSEPVNALTGFGFSFLLGVAVYHYRNVVPVSLPLTLVLAASMVLSRGTPLIELTSILTSASGALWLAFVPQGRVLAYNRVGELSYSIYIWHWPIGQILVTQIPGIAWPTLFALMIACVLPVAFVSWHLLEKPALRKTALLAHAIARIAAPLPRPAYWRMRERQA